MNVLQTFEHIPDITNLPFVRRRNRWEGSFYINGDKHRKKDKTIVYIIGERIRISEQGGENLSLYDWVMMMNTCDFNQACKIIEDHTGSNPIQKARELPSKFGGPKLLEYWKVKYDGSLYTWMSGLFGETAVRGVFSEYKVGLQFNDVAVFWYINSAGDVCHDNRIRYSDNGKRSQNWRNLKVGDGYRNRCYFGDHLLPKWKGRVAVVESEKTALIMRIARPDMLWLACGGSSKLIKGRTEERFRDYDVGGAMGFECSLCSKRIGDEDCRQSRIDGKVTRPVEPCAGGCVEWWIGGEIEVGWDVADLVVSRVLSGVFKSK